MKKISKIKNYLKKTKLTLTVIAVLLTLFSTPVFAADPLASINSLSY